ncbi:hypothetical protein HDU67_005184, partial [Dinochytrium kinnereticum]
MQESLMAPVPPPHRRHSVARVFELPSAVPVTPKTLLMDCNKSMPPTPPSRSGASTIDRSGFPAEQATPTQIDNKTSVGDQTILSIQFEDPIDLTFTPFEDTSFSSNNDSAFHWPDTAPPGSFTPSKSQTNQTSSSRGSTSREDDPTKRVPNPLSKKGRKTSVIPSSSLNGESKKVLATVGTWGPSSNSAAFSGFGG